MFLPCINKSDAEDGDDEGGCGGGGVVGGGARKKLEILSTATSTQSPINHKTNKQTT